MSPVVVLLSLILVSVAIGSSGCVLGDTVLVLLVVVIMGGSEGFDGMPTVIMWTLGVGILPLDIGSTAEPSPEPEASIE